ncbi:hypothetical protein [Ferruginibacter sp. SUN106]|uniref:hypothetical protein n=1 Tax=Ferruginibacter sp. SUN106 TaxID=2978348 RepID=UPI003D360EE6
MNDNKFPGEIKDLFYSIYNNDQANLKLVAVELQNRGLGYMEILMLTVKELQIGLGEAITLLEIPDYTG